MGAEFLDQGTPLLSFSLIFLCNLCKMCNCLCVQQVLVSSFRELLNFCLEFTSFRHCQRILGEVSDSDLFARDIFLYI